LVELEQTLTNSLGTRVQIERKENGGKIVIDFFSNEDLRSLLQIFQGKGDGMPRNLMEEFIKKQEAAALAAKAPDAPAVEPVETLVDDRAPVEKKQDENDLYSIKNFSV
ncbi:MAG: hypothetical protein AAB597_03550, partial [Patescibacteria group bacterium]